MARPRAPCFPARLTPDSTFPRTRACAPTMARPSSYDPAYAARARMLCRLGATPSDLASAFAVSLATLYRWLHAHPRFAAQVAMGKLEAETVVEPTRYERATGYQVPVERVFIRNTGKPVIACYKKHIHANPRAALRWLRKRRPDRWTLGEGDAWSKRKWPEGAPWQKQANKSTVSQNAQTIRKIMMVALVRMIQVHRLTRPELAALIQHLLSGLRPSAGNGDRDVPAQNTAFTDRPSDPPPPMTSPGLPVIDDKRHLIERAEPVAPPQPPLACCEDQPERPVPHRLRRVPRGRHRRATRVRVIMAEYGLASVSRLSVRREQRRRIYFKAPRRVRCHIRGSLRLRDPPLGAE